MSDTIFLVYPENVAAIWDQVEPLVTAALRGRPTHDAEDIFHLLMARHCHLWAQMNDGRVEAMVVTEFNAYPKGVWVNAWLAGARRDARMNDDAFLAVIEKWADAHRCRGFECSGRSGWIRRFPKARIEGLVMRWTK